MFMTPHLDSHSTSTTELTPNQKSYQLSKPEIEFHVMEEMYPVLRMCTTFLDKLGLSWAKLSSATY